VQRPGAQRKDDKIAQDADHRAIDIPRLGERVVPDKRSGESGQQGTAECTAVGFHAEQRCRQRHQNQRRPEGIGEHQNSEDIRHHKSQQHSADTGCQVDPSQQP